jgi:type I restriction enzyme M protein
MVGRQAAGDQLVSRAELARLAGVRRPAVTNWERRHADFPQAVVTGEKEYFRLVEVVGWLAGRAVPSGARAQDEAPGVTYADRVRRNLGATPASSAAAPPAIRDEAESRSVDTLVGPLADRVRGSAPMADYLNLIFSVLLLRPSVATATPPVGVRTADAVRLLRRIGEAADKELRRRGLYPGMLASLVRLQPHGYEDIEEVVRLSGRLGPDAFRQLLDLYREDRGLNSRDSFTPRGLARLMAELLLLDASGPVEIYDPYARAGELLATAVEVAHDQGDAVRPVVFGQSPDVASLRLAGVNLAVHGISAQLTSRSAAPWCSPRWPERKVDLILTRPPFNDKTTIDKRDEVNWEYGSPSASNNNFAWLQHILTSLNERGRAAVLMPNHASVSEHERDIRAQMVRRGVVCCVIALPRQLLTGTTMPAVLWLMRSPTDEPHEVLFIDARQRGEKGTSRRVLTEEDVADVVGAVRAWCFDSVLVEGFSASADPDWISLNDYSLSPSDYVNTGTARARTDVSDVREEMHRLRYQAREADYLLDGLRLEDFLSGWADRDAAAWQRVPLKSLCDIQAGPFYSRLRTKARSAEGTVPAVLPKHIRDRRIVAARDELVSEETARELQRFRLEAGDIICVRTGTTGASALVEEGQAGWLSTTNLLRLHNFQPGVDPRYLLAYLSLHEVVEWIRNRSMAASVVATIKASTLGRLPILLPSQEEQWRIGTTLSALDEQIAAYRQLTEATCRIHTTMSEYLLQAKQ